MKFKKEIKEFIDLINNTDCLAFTYFMEAMYDIRERFSHNQKLIDTVNDLIEAGDSDEFHEETDGLVYLDDEQNGDYIVFNRWCEIIFSELRNETGSDEYVKNIYKNMSMFKAFVRIC